MRKLENEIADYEHEGNYYFLKIDPVDGYRIWRIIDKKECWHRPCTVEERKEIDDAYIELNKVV